MNSGKPIYGMHRGTVGFLMNEFSERAPRGAARRRRDHADPSAADARARRQRARAHEAHAINEVSLFRQTYQAARLRILIDGKERLAELVADGVLVATPGGLDRLQSFGAGADHPDQRAAAGAHPDQPVPAAALARRAAARHARACRSRCWKPRSARSRRSPTMTRCARVRSVEIQHGPRDRDARCCSIPATASTSASCASSSGTDHERRRTNGGQRGGKALPFSIFRLSRPSFVFRMLNRALMADRYTLRAGLSACRAHLNQKSVNMVSGFAACGRAPE